MIMIFYVLRTSILTLGTMGWWVLINHFHAQIPTWDPLVIKIIGICRSYYTNYSKTVMRNKTEIKLVIKKCLPKLSVKSLGHSLCVGFPYLHSWVNLARGHSFWECQCHWGKVMFSPWYRNILFRNDGITDSGFKEMQCIKTFYVKI